MRRAVFAFVCVVAVAAIILSVVPTPRAKLPPLDPPNPSAAGLEPALVARIDEVRALVDADPDSPAAWGRLGAVFDVHDLLHAAIVCYERAEMLDPDDFRWPYLLGRARLVGDQRAALRDFERALARRDDYATLHLRLGEGHAALEHAQRAREAFARAVELDPSLPRAHLGLGRVALMAGDAATALRHLEQAVAHGASSGELHGLLAEAHRRLGNLELAKEHVSRAASGAKFEPLPDPIHRELTWNEGVTIRWHEMRGEQHRRDGRLDLALAEWEAAVRSNPDAVRAHSNLGLLYAQAGRHADAIRMFERVLDLDPDQIDAKLDLGTLHIREGRVAEGIDMIRRFCAEHPENDMGPLRLARALRDAGRPDEAEQTLQAALETHPDSANVHYAYAIQLAGAGRMREAAAGFARAAALDPENVLAHVSLARALGRQRRFGEAIAAVRRGLETNPDDRRLTNALAWMLATCPDDALRDGAEALRLAEALCRQSQSRDPVTLDTLAAAFAEVGDFESAERTLQRALDLPGLSEQGVLVQRLRSRLPAYRKGAPHRDANLNE